MRFSGKLALKVGVLGVAAGAILTPLTAAHALPLTPTLTVSPSTHLENGQTVTVTGTNFPTTTPSTSTIYIVECSGLTPASCDEGKVVTATVDASGTLAATPFTVEAGPVGSGSCPGATTTDACYIEATTDPDPTDVAAAGVAQISFNPYLAVSPQTGVHNGDKLKVAGLGFKPSSAAAIIECVNLSGNESACDTSAPVLTNTDANGTLSATFAAVGGKVGTGNCSGKTCYIVATTDLDPTMPDPNQEAAAAVTFAKSSSKPAATKTKASFSKKKDKISGKVTSAGKGVKGLKTELDLKSGKKWKKVDTDTTAKGGKFDYKKIKKNGKYEVKTHKTKAYKSSTSKKIKVKV